jgi:hypothetical protein
MLSVMADFGRFLPLSNRPHDDEAGVTSDRRMALADVVDEASVMLTTVDPAAAGPFAAEFAREARIVAGDDQPVRGADDLGRIAAVIRAGRRKPAKALVRGVRAQLMLARELGVPPRIDTTTLGVVALYAATTAPLERRAVIKGHALRATDAEWGFGRGPMLEGTGVEIVSFLLGLSDAAPRRAVEGSPPSQDEGSSRS